MRRALERLAETFIAPAQRRAFARLISDGPDQVSVGEGGHRRTPIEVSEDLWGPDVALDLWPEPEGQGAEELFRANLKRLIEDDGRPLAQLGRDAFDSDQGRKKIARALDVGWPRPDVAEGLAIALNVEIADLFARIHPAE